MEEYYNNVYDKIFKEFKEFVEKNSKYGARVVKYNTNTTSYFPLITCVLTNNTDTDYCTIDRRERYEALYFLLYYLSNTDIELFFSIC